MEKENDIDLIKPNDFKLITNKNKLFDTLLCSICHLWPMEALYCNNCESLYCKCCAKEKNEDKIFPICQICPPANKQHLTNPIKPIANILNKAKFECQHCNEIQSYDKIMNHIAYCERNPSRLIICKMCTIEISADNLSTHDCISHLLKEIEKIKHKLNEYDKLTPFNYSEYTKLKNTLKFIILI
jgi:hypothetical protein